MALLGSLTVGILGDMGGMTDTFNKAQKRNAEIF